MRGTSGNGRQSFPWQSAKYGAKVLPGTYAVPYPAVLAFDLERVAGTLQKGH
ncbi:MAG: hypothetical protein ABSH53_04555 [Holophaga sp.]|jgi:hypothetical protein